MSQELQEFVTPIGPGDSRLSVVAVTTASVHIDLTGANYTALKSAIDGGRLIVLKAESDVWYRWSPATSGGTVDETTTAASTPANQCSIIFAGERSEERPPPGTLGLIVKAAVACKLRMHIGSKAPDEFTRGV